MKADEEIRFVACIRCLVRRPPHRLTAGLCTEVHHCDALIRAAAKSNPQQEKPNDERAA